MVLATQPIYFFTRPGLDAANSPEQIGRIIRREAGNGCFAVTFQLHEYRPGTLDYYTGPNLSHANTEADFRRLLAQHPRLVVLTDEKFWNQWSDRPAGLKVIHTQWIGWERWLVAVQDGPATKPPP